VPRLLRHSSGYGSTLGRTACHHANRVPTLAICPMNGHCWDSLQDQGSLFSMPIPIVSR
jgi:hypothetical protein